MYSLVHIHKAVGVLLFTVIFGEVLYKVNGICGTLIPNRKPHIECQRTKMFGFKMTDAESREKGTQDNNIKQTEALLLR